MADRPRSGSGGRRRTSTERAADLAAAQVEQIVAASEEATKRLRAEMQAEVERLHAEAKAESERVRVEAAAEAERIRAEVIVEADQIRAHAREESQAEMAEARRQAIQLGEEARREARERIAQAQAAADEALADAKALARGLRQLASNLTDNAERILRDVQAGHRKLTADLRAAGGSGPNADSAVDLPSGRRRPRVENSPFEDIDLPSWVES